MTASALLIYLGQTSLAISVLIALVLLIRRPFAYWFGAKAAYALWAVPLIRLVLPPLPANWTLAGVFQQSGQTLAQAPIEAATLTPDALAASLALLIADAGQTGPAALPTTQSANVSSLLDNAPPILLLLWLMGATLALALIYTRQHTAINALRKDAYTPSFATRRLADKVQTCLGLQSKTVRILISPNATGPLVSGFLRPVILLPNWFETDYTPADQDTALSHELMHIKRGDLWALHASMVALALQWFNPLAWMASRTVRIDQEAACDADVLALGQTTPHAYGETLVKTARMARPCASISATYPAHAPAHIMSLSLNHALYERLKTMKNPHPTPLQRLTGTALTASVGAAALLVSACAGSYAQSADLDETENKIEQEIRVESIFISDDLEGGPNVKIIKNGKTVELDDLEDLEDENVFVLHSEDFIGERPDVADFAAQMRELAKDPVKNQREIEELAADFETRMETWADTHVLHKQRRVIRLSDSDDFNWTESGETVDCGDGQQVRTVIIQRDDEAGTEEKTVNVECGAAHIDSEAIIADLRARGDLSEERLLEVEKRLEEAKAKLAETNGKMEKLRFKFEIEEKDELAEE